MGETSIRGTESLAVYWGLRQWIQGDPLPPTTRPEVSGVTRRFIWKTGSVIYKNRRERSKIICLCFLFFLKKQQCLTGSVVIVNTVKPGQFE